MLTDSEKRQFERVCYEHIWSALGTHSLSDATGAESQARSAAISVRQLVDTAQIYRQCWNQVRPIVSRQGFHAFIAIVDGAAEQADPAQPVR